ncbi:MAG: HD domain-containing protein [Planctomycetes bacterium]|nr:HD domain-containing protein [Planctomycetota bacterium]
MPCNTLLRCAVCTTVLPLRLARHDEQAGDWTCAECGSTMSAVFDATAPVHVLRNARPAAKPPVADSTLSLSRYVPKGTAQEALPTRKRLVCPFQTSDSREFDAEITSGAGLIHELQGEAFLKNSNQSRGAEPFDARLAHVMVQQIDATAAAVEDMFKRISLCKSPELNKLPILAEDALTRAADDIDLFVTLGLNRPGTDALPRHSLHSGMLAMSIAAHMGFDGQTLVDLGLGCLIHDVGMLKLEDALYARPRVLEHDEFLPILKHPIYTLDILSPHMGALSTGTRAVAYQLHERCDGSGYPRARTADSIHQLAKIAAVSDVYIALVSSRPHRPGLMPYFAIERLLRDTRQGLFDPAVVRALLHTVSLFPLGSFVLLSDGRAGQVIRSNGKTYDRPVVEVCRKDGRAVQRDIIDLTAEQDIKIVRAMQSLNEAT